MEQHGEYRIEKQGNILLVEIWGPSNKESMQAYSADLMQTMRAMRHHPWANIIVFHGLGLVPPDAEATLVDLVKRRKKMGLVYTAVVLGDVGAKALHEAQFTRVYRQAGINFAFYDRLSEAYEWLATQGFERAAG